MGEAPEATLRIDLGIALDANSNRLRSALTLELAKPINLDPKRRFQFEIDPQSYRISSCETETDLLPDYWLDDSLPSDWFDRAQDLVENWDTLIVEELCPWFADQWESAGGPVVISPAYLFFHGGLNKPRYDLERRQWVEVGEIWPKET